MFFWGELFFHKSILSSHILPVANRIMMGIIFTNLTEKKNVLAFNFFLSVNEQFQESFLWDKGGKDLTLAMRQKSERKTTSFSQEKVWQLLLKLYRLYCTSVFQQKMWAINA